MFDWTFKIFSVMSDKQYNELKQEIQKMALNFDNLDAAVAKVQADVQNVLRVLTEGEAPAQERIDRATNILNGVDRDLDALAPDAPAEPTPEPAPEG